MDYNRNTSQRYTLESIAQRKQEVLTELKEQKEAMTETTRDIFAPLAPMASGANTLMRSFNTGMAIFDGVMMGLKIMRKIRNMFK